MYRHDGMKLLAMAMEEVCQSGEEIFPIQATHVRWDEEKTRMVIATLGYDRAFFIGIIVAPYVVFSEEDQDVWVREPLPVFEQRWREFPGDYSIQGNLELALLGNLEELIALEFEDRSGTGESEVLDFGEGFKIRERFV